MDYSNKENYQKPILVVAKNQIKITVFVLSNNMHKFPTILFVFVIKLYALNNVFRYIKWFIFARSNTIFVNGLVLRKKASGLVRTFGTDDFEASNG